MAQDFILGKNLNLFFQLNGVYFPAAHSTDCSITVTQDIRETTTKDTRRAKTFDPTSKYSYTLSFKEWTNFIDVSNLSVFQDSILQGQKLLFVFTDQFSIEWSGRVIITSTDTDSPFSAISSSTITLQGDGELLKVTTNVPPIPLPSGTVLIKDQFGNLIATVVAPGQYNVLRFNIIDCGAAIQPTPDLIIMAGAN